MIALGVFLVLIGLVAPKIQLPELPQQEIDPIRIDPSLLQNNESGSFPEKVLIPSLGLDVKIDPAHVVNGRWEVFEEVASYGLGSGIPGKNGNTVIFAHAKEGLFLPLKSIKKGTVIYIETGDSQHEYKVEEIKEVLPSDVSVIKPRDEEILTLYTCTGFADSKRLIVVAEKIIKH